MKSHMHAALPWFRLIPVTKEGLSGDCKFKGCQGNSIKTFSQNNKWKLWDRESTCLRCEVLDSLPSIEEEEEKVILSQAHVLKGSQLCWCCRNFRRKSHIEGISLGEVTCPGSFLTDIKWAALFFYHKVVLGHTALFQAPKQWNQLPWTQTWKSKTKSICI